MLWRELYAHSSCNTELELSKDLARAKANVAGNGQVWQSKSRYKSSTFSIQCIWTKVHWKATEEISRSVKAKKILAQRKRMGYFSIILGSPGNSATYHKQELTLGNSVGTWENSIFWHRQCLSCCRPSSKRKHPLD